MNKKVYFSYAKEDEVLAKTIADSVRIKLKDVDILAFPLSDNANGELEESNVYIPIVTTSLLNEENSKLYFEEIKRVEGLEALGKIKRETISNSYQFLYNELSKLNSDIERNIYASNVGQSFLFIEDIEDTQKYGSFINDLVFKINQDLSFTTHKEKYEYDVFLSWTYKDKGTKDKIKDYLVSHNLSVYDSEVLCHNRFVDNFLSALYRSKVYILLLSDSLNRTDIISDVKREISCATDLEKKLHLNVIILKLSESYLNPNLNEEINVERFFFDVTGGYDTIDGTKRKEEGTNIINNDVLEEIYDHTKTYLFNRSIGRPFFYNPDYGIICDKKIDNVQNIFGRDEEISNIKKAFDSGARMVILSGVGGIGKTKIADKFASLMLETHQIQYLQTVRVGSEDIASSNAYDILLSNIRYTKENEQYIKLSTSKEERQNKRLEIIEKLPNYSLIIVDNINKIDQRSLDKIIQRLNVKLILTSRAKIEETDEIKTIEVKPFSTTELYPEFVKRSKIDTLTKEEFERIYNACFGHTMTIIMLSNIARHNNYTKEKLLEITESLSKIKDRYDIEHNEIRNKLTIVEQLKELFKITNLAYPDIEKKILLNLSTLNDGLIETNDLISYFNLDSHNEINDLVENGYLEMKANSLYMQELLSNVTPLVLENEYTHSDFKSIIDYIINNMDYSDPHKALDRSFHALYTIYSYSKVLDDRLFEAVNKSYYSLYDDGDILERITILKNKSDNNEISPVLGLFESSIILKKDPTNMEALDNFINSLNNTPAVEHKAIFRHICYSLNILKSDGRIKNLENTLESTIKQIMMDSLVDGDTKEMVWIKQIELFHLFPIYSEINSKKCFKYYKEYIASQKNNPNNTLFYYNLKLLLSYGSYEKTNKLVNEYYEKGNNNHYLSILLKHPIISIRSVIFADKIGSYEPKYEGDYFFKTFFIYLDNVITNERVEAKKLFESAVYYYNFLFENDLTLLKSEEFISNILYIVNSLNSKFGNDYVNTEFKKELYSLIEEYKTSSNLTSYKDISNNIVITSFYRAFRDSKALEYADLLFTNATTLFKKDSLELLNEYYNYFVIVYDYYSINKLNNAVSNYIDLAERIDYLGKNNIDVFHSITSSFIKIPEDKIHKMYHRCLLSTEDIRLIIDAKITYYTYLKNKYNDYDSIMLLYEIIDLTIKAYDIDYSNIINFLFLEYSNDFQGRISEEIIINLKNRIIEALTHIKKTAKDENRIFAITSIDRLKLNNEIKTKKDKKAYIKLFKKLIHFKQINNINTIYKQLSLESKDELYKLFIKNPIRRKKLILCDRLLNVSKEAYESFEPYKFKEKKLIDYLYEHHRKPRKAIKRYLSQFDEISKFFFEHSLPTKEVITDKDIKNEYKDSLLIIPSEVKRIDAIFKDKELIVYYGNFILSDKMSKLNELDISKSNLYDIAKEVYGIGKSDGKIAFIKYPTGITINNNIVDEALLKNAPFIRRVDFDIFIDKIEKEAYKNMQASFYINGYNDIVFIDNRKKGDVSVPAMPCSIDVDPTAFDGTRVRLLLVEKDDRYPKDNTYIYDNNDKPMTWHFVNVTSSGEEIKKMVLIIGKNNDAYIGGYHFNTRKLNENDKYKRSE